MVEFLVGLAGVIAFITYYLGFFWVLHKLGWLESCQENGNTVWIFLPIFVPFLMMFVLLLLFYAIPSLRKEIMSLF